MQLVDDSFRLRWLEIEDTEGNGWHYERRDTPKEPLPEAQVRSMVITHAIQAYIAKGDDGSALLKHDGPGLPERIVVDQLSGLPCGAGKDSYRMGPVEY